MCGPRYRSCAAARCRLVGHSLTAQPQAATTPAAPAAPAAQPSPLHALPPVLAALFPQHAAAPTAAAAALTAHSLPPPPQQHLQPALPQQVMQPQQSFAPVTPLQVKLAAGVLGGRFDRALSSRLSAGAVSVSRADVAALLHHLAADEQLLDEIAAVLRNG